MPKKKLLTRLDYPLYFRYGDFIKSKGVSYENNSSNKHQVEKGYRTWPVYKDILLVNKIKEDEKDNAL